MRSRHVAREWALRILYARQMSHRTVQECVDDILEGARDDQNLKFCKALVQRAADEDVKLDELIKLSVEKWDLRRLAVLDLLILRMAISEFLYFDDIPYKVTINEAIELAKRYSTSQSGRFVNGILDAVSASLRKKSMKPNVSAEAS